MNEEYLIVRKKQEEYFKSGKTLLIKERIKNLKTLKSAMKSNEALLLDALYKDLGKTHFEGYETELGVVYSEINHLIKHTKTWAKKKRVGTPLAHFPSSSYILKQPKGNVLIFSPWNYPIQLALNPLAAALAAGCTVILKPSRYSEYTSKALKKVLGEFFEEGLVYVVEGGHQANQDLLDLRFDHIFFTGSPNVGRVVMAAASKNVTPVTLELGGKSPVIIDESANIKLSATRLAWGKYLNAGQTCVAPDYLLIDEKVKDRFVVEFKNAITKMFSANPISSPDLPKIINEKHFERAKSLLKCGKIVIGGGFDNNTLKIEPTLIEKPDLSSPLMCDEIFAPILPLITYKSFDDALEFIRQREKPLAFYIFSKNNERVKKAHEVLTFGGGCVNDCVVHLTNPNMPFGGVGNSGLGSYHSKQGFDTFTHEKSILRKSLLLDIPVRYAPYNSNLKDKIVRLLMH